MQRILLVEDDWKLNQNICYALKKEGYDVSAAHSLAEARQIVLQCHTYPDEALPDFDPDEDIQLALLDINLPDGDGFSFCEWIKERWVIPVLFLTARDLEEDALRGYELGAEDYVTKPFSMKILLKKIDVILKRNKTEGREIFSDGYLRIVFDRAKVEVDGQECPVTPTELRLLKELTSHMGRLLTYEVLLHRVWDSAGQFVDKHTLAVNINRLRGKIEDEQHKYISNVYGMGYQWLD